MKIKTLPAKRLVRLPKTWRQWLVLLILGLVFLASFLIPDTPLWAARLSLLRQPASPLPHLELARLAADISDWEVAGREYQLAVRFFQQQGGLPGISPLSDAGEFLVPRHDSLQGEVERWEAILAQQPDYRDGHLQLAALFFRLGQDQEAVNHWREAWRLDPTHPEVVAFGRVLEIVPEERAAY